MVCWKYTPLFGIFQAFFLFLIATYQYSSRSSIRHDNTCASERKVAPAALLMSLECLFPIGAECPQDGQGGGGSGENSSTAALPSRVRFTASPRWAFYTVSAGTFPGAMQFARLSSKDFHDFSTIRVTKQEKSPHFTKDEKW